MGKQPKPAAVASAGNATLLELLARLAAEPGGAADVSAAELGSWPAGDVAALKASGLLAPGAPATRVECPGCEHACAMPVEVVRRPSRPAALFVVCDKEAALGRVRVALAHLEQWRLTRQSVADAVARMLGDSAVPVGNSVADFRVGVVQGLQGRRAAVLAWNVEGPTLRVAGHALELALVLDIARGVLWLDLAQLVRCADTPTGAGSGADETPEERRLRYEALLEQERRVSPKGCLKRAVARSGVKESAFKQVVYRKRKPKTAMEHMASSATGPVLAKRQNKR